MQERRSWPRYQMEVPIEVSGRFNTGEYFILKGMLDNISVKGALGNFDNPLQMCTQVELSIELPLDGGWMVYKGEVIRVEESPSSFCVALKFESSVPVFRAKQ